MAQQRPRPRAGQAQQLVLRGRAGGADGAHDARVAARQQLLVGLAEGARAELLGALAGEDGVRVRVHEAGDDQPASRIEHVRLGGQGRGQGGAWPDPDDAPLARGQRAVLDHAQSPMRALHVALRHGDEL